MDIEATTSPQEILDAVRWSYRLLLGREESNAELLRYHVGTHKSIADVRRTFMNSDEFLGHSGCGADDEIFNAFPKVNASGEDGFFIDFVGSKTRCAYLPESLHRYSGKVYGRPGTNEDELHERAEWVGTLKAVQEAKQRGSRLVVAELGAGWGPWLVIAAKAAAACGIKDVALVGVEGSKEHVAFMLQHMEDNKIDPSCFTLLHAIAAVEDGLDYFPVLDSPRENWGARARSGTEASVCNDAAFEKVQAVSLATLAAEHAPFDLVHCDIQGAEGDVLTASAATLNARVRRIVIGTHGREIEGRLLTFFGSNGWILEHDQSCKFEQGGDGQMNLLSDGVQVWRNPAEVSA